MSWQRGSTAERIAVRIACLSVALAVTAIVAACGGSNSPATSTASTATAPTSSTGHTTTSDASSTPAGAPSHAVTTLKLSANPSGQLRYNTSSLSAKAGKVTIHFTNDSPLPHDVVVQKGTNGATIAATPTFDHGTKAITMTLAPGKYTYYCSVPGHRQAGMVGTLTVSG